MASYDLIGSILGILLISFMAIFTLVLAYKETKKRMHVSNVQLVLMDKIYRVLCMEYPDDVTSSVVTGNE